MQEALNINKELILVEYQKLLIEYYLLEGSVWWHSKVFFNNFVSIYAELTAADPNQKLATMFKLNFLEYICFNNIFYQSLLIKL